MSTTRIIRTYPWVCGHCGGKGFITVFQYETTQARTSMTEPCKVCGGSGVIMIQEETIIDGDSVSITQGNVRHE